MSAYPLWEEGNSTTQSASFSVASGKVVALFAVGLERYKVRESHSGVQDKQRLCVNRIISEYNEESVRVKLPPTSACDCFIFEASYMNEIALTEEPVVSGGKPWQLTVCDNFRIIGVPGVYRLHLNDDTAIGKVQVYAEQYDIQELPPQIAGLFFS